MSAYWTLILLYNLWTFKYRSCCVMSTTHIPFTLVLDGHTDVRYLHGYPLQRISNHLTNPLSSELINIQKKTSSNHILPISTVSFTTLVSRESSFNLALRPYGVHFFTTFISLQNTRIMPAEESRVSEAYNFFLLRDSICFNC